MKLALVSYPVHPSKNRLSTQFTDSEALPKTTFHQVNKVVEKNDYEVVIYYLKENPDSVASELEAVCAAFYKLFAADYVPATYAVYDKSSKYIGVVSEEIPGFKSLAVDPLKEEDLKVDFLEQRKISLEDIEKLEKEIRELEDQSYHLEKRARRLDFNEHQLQAELKDRKNPEKKIDELRKEFKANAKEKVDLFDVRCQVEAKKEEFYKKLEEKNDIRKKELENFRIVKGLAHSLTASYIFMEDDLHQNNLSKTGKRFDFDMSLWRIFYNYKDSKLTYFRRPTSDTVKVTSKDIISFPNLKDAKPFYWPTHTAQAYSSSFLSTVSSVFPLLLTNAYPKEANALYQKLERNPVFEYYKYNILSKYILTYADIYKSVARLHMRKECMIGQDNMIEYIAREQADRIVEFENALVKIPEFCVFFKKHYKRIAAELIEELNTQQIKVEQEQIDSTCTQLLELIEISLAKMASSKPNLDRKESKEEIRFVSHATFEEVKTAVILAMNDYLNPSFSYFRTRTHNLIATYIKTFCEKMKLDLNDKNAPLEGIKTIYVEISDKLKNLPVTEMHKQLTTLLTMIKDKLPPAELAAIKASEASPAEKYTRKIQ